MLKFLSGKRRIEPAGLSSQSSAIAEYRGPPPAVHRGRNCGQEHACDEFKVVGVSANYSDDTA